MSGNGRNKKPPGRESGADPAEPSVVQPSPGRTDDNATDDNATGDNASGEALPEFEIDGSSGSLVGEPRATCSTLEEFEEFAPKEFGALRAGEQVADTSAGIERDTRYGAEPDPEDIGFLRNRAQLSASPRVRQGMGTIALQPGRADFTADRNPGGRSARQTELSMAGDFPATTDSLQAGNLSQLTDAEIMQRAGAGDEACYEFLVTKYRRPIIGFMYRMVHNQAVAEELAQEVFLRVYRARSSYRAEARFTTWLYRIAANMAINHARDTKSERNSSSVYLDQGDEVTGSKPDVADLRPLAEQDMMRDERMRQIREQVMALPERQRMAVVMHKYQDMDYRQIGAVLKLSESATKSLLFRAYQTLRERLKEFA